jgi:hypothetical protein
MSNSIDALAASIATVILLVFCASLAWRQQRRLVAMQTRLDSLSSAIRRLEVAHEGLLVRFMNLPRSRKARKSSSPSSDIRKEELTVPTQLDEKNSKGSALYVVAPKTSPE